MVIVLILLFLILVGGNVYQFRKLLTSNILFAKLNSSYEREKRLNQVNSGNVLGFLEASAITGDRTAKRLLEAHKALPEEGSIELKSLSTKEAEPTPPAWLHDTSVKTPPEQHWEFFVKDLKRENKEDNRIQVLEHWVLKMGNRLTLTEKSDILDLFENEFIRQMAREIFSTAEELDRVEKEKKREKVVRNR